MLPTKSEPSSAEAVDKSTDVKETSPSKESKNPLMIALQEKRKKEIETVLNGKNKVSKDKENVKTGEEKEIVVKEKTKKVKKEKKQVEKKEKKGKKAGKVKPAKKEKPAKPVKSPKPVKKPKDEALEDSGTENTKNYPKFLYWLKDNKITQKSLAVRTHLSSNTIYRLTHFGIATKSVVKLVAMELGITDEELRKKLEK